jgi:hypothetical protein
MTFLQVGPNQTSKHRIYNKVINSSFSGYYLFISIGPKVGDMKWATPEGCYGRMRYNNKLPSSPTRATPDILD